METLLILLHTDDSTSFKYKSSLIGESTAANNNGVFKDLKIAFPLKYLSNFWKSLEMSLIICKTHLKLNWTNVNCC